MTIRNALLLAGAFILFSLATAWAGRAGHIDEDTARRATQVAAGLIVVYYANLVPKTLEPLAERCDPARVQALQRFSGRVLLIGGLGYSLAWILVTPLRPAGITAMAILGVCVALVMGRWGWTLATARRGPASPER